MVKAGAIRAEAEEAALALEVIASVQPVVIKSPTPEELLVLK